MSTVFTLLKIRFCSKLSFEMNGNLKGWYVVFPILIFFQPLINCISLDHERFVDIFPLKFSSILFIIFPLFRFGTFGVDHAYNAGLDLEIPGVGKWRTADYVGRSILSRKVTVTTVKQRAKKVLELVQKCAQRAPEVSVNLTSYKL